MAKMEKIRNTQVIDNKEDKFFYFPMVSMGCTGSGYRMGERFLSFSLFFFLHSTACGGQIEVGTLKHEVV